jgi:hypothetical protein
MDQAPRALPPCDIGANDDVLGQADVDFEEDPPSPRTTTAIVVVEGAADEHAHRDSRMLAQEADTPSSAAPASM